MVVPTSVPASTFRSSFRVEGLRLPASSSDVDMETPILPVEDYRQNGRYVTDAILHDGEAYHTEFSGTLRCCGRPPSNIPRERPRATWPLDGAVHCSIVGHFVPI
ncbi:hypothetical protein AHIS1636_12120 [Arthrobacter mangrovi]|uniref:Uncharacterized protein n=1 Tax=Arthrobacter mangrovi TaxID=2966350 RepID=A0ABQ5MS32_9MICC|nr:hypothetical protein AHIS1636_12120 [Arthrobacter mangrovi]